MQMQQDGSSHELGQVLQRPGIPLTGERCQYEHGSSSESKELPVTPVTLYKSKRVSDYGDMISVNERYISYPIRNGLIRVISQLSVNRLLLRRHEHHSVTELSFFHDKSDLLLSSGTDDHVNIWKLTESDIGIQQEVVKIVPVQAQRVRWHPTDSNQIAVMNTCQVSVIEMTNVSPTGAGVHSINSISIQCAGHESQVNDIGFSLDGNFIASAGTDGRVLLHSLWQATAPCTLGIHQVIVPCHGESVTRIIFGRNEQKQVIFGSKGSKMLSVWTDITSTTPKHVQTLGISTSTDTKHSVELDPSGQFIFVADRTQPILYVVHLSFTAMGMHMDNIREFSVAHPILSMTVSNRRPKRTGTPLVTHLELQLFCIQTAAIQQYHVLADECFIPPTVKETSMPSSTSNLQTVGAVTTEDSVEKPASPESKAVAPDALKDYITQTVRQVIRQEIQSVLIPAIGRIVLHTTENNIMQPLQQSVDLLIRDQVVPLVEKKLDEDLLVKSIAEQVKEPVKESFRECFRASIIPSFQAATQKMLGQINSKIPQPQNLSAELRAMQLQLAELIESVNALKATNPPALEKEAIDPTQAIGDLLAAEKYEEGFQMALGAENVSLVVFACQNSLSGVVLDNASPKLSPVIILCLIQQLGLVMTEQLSLKLDWLRDSLLVLNVKDPSIVHLAPNVLQQLQKNLGDVLPEYRDSRYAIVQHILKSTMS